MERGKGPTPRGPAPVADGVVRKFRERIANSRFVDDPVMELCADLGRELAEPVERMQKENSLTQVRKFFNQVRVLQNQARS